MRTGGKGYALGNSTSGLIGEKAGASDAYMGRRMPGWRSDGRENLIEKIERQNRRDDGVEMGKKGFRPVATTALLETLRASYWQIAEHHFEHDGEISKGHLLHDLKQAGCSFQYRDQLVQYMIKQGEIEMFRHKGHLMLRRSPLRLIPKFTQRKGAKECQR